MKIAIIVNSTSGKKKKFDREILPALKSTFEVTVFETQRAGHARELAMEAGKNHTIVLAAGGDGTLHEVLNGILECNNLPVLGVIPLGSGNDFATACGISADGDFIKNRLLQNQPKLTDVGKITCLDEQGNAIQQYFINACSVGMGPATVQRMKKQPDWMGANLRYLISILQTFFSHRPENVTLNCDNFDWQGKARVLAVANGKSFGNKIYIAPDAKPDDGLLNVFIGGDIPLLKFLLHLHTIKAKRKIISDDVFYFEGSAFEVSSLQSLMIEADGELVGFLPASIDVAKPVRFLR